MSENAVLEWCGAPIESLPRETLLVAIKWCVSEIDRLRTERRRVHDYVDWAGFLSAADAEAPDGSLRK